jgi:hypothetical protein
VVSTRLHLQEDSCAYSILRGSHLTSHALHATGAPAHKAVSLQGLVVLNMLGELAQRVAGGRALCPAEE